MLARSSAKLGDLAGAEAWMALLDPYSENIHGDSAYRYARAYVDTARQDWASVTRVLGTSPPACGPTPSSAWAMSRPLPMSCS